MARVFAKTSADKLILTQTRASQVFDAIVSLGIAGLSFICFIFPGFMMIATGNPLATIVGILCFLPMACFIIFGINSFIRAFFPRKIIIDRTADSIFLNGKAIGRIEDLRDMKIVFTGFYSPSRNTLRATMASGKTYCVEATGYSGSRIELRQLCDLIAEFTQRFDLYAR